MTVKTWAEVTDAPEFKALSADRQAEARELYFVEVVAPRVPRGQLSRARQLFDADTYIRKQDLPADVQPYEGAGAGRGGQGGPTAAEGRQARSLAQAAQPRRPNEPRRGTLRGVQPFVATEPPPSSLPALDQPGMTAADQINNPAPEYDPATTVSRDPLSMPVPGFVPSRADLVEQSKSPERRKAEAAAAAGLDINAVQAQMATRAKRDATAAGTRGPGDLAMDTLVALAKGGNSVMALPIAVLAPGGRAYGTLREQRKQLEAMESPELQARRAQYAERIAASPNETGKFLTALYELASNPSIGFSVMAEQLPIMGAVLVAGPAGGALARGGLATAGRVSPSLAIASEIAGGAAIAGRAGQVAGMAGASAIGAAGDAASNVFDQLMDRQATPNEVLRQNPDYVALVNAGMPPADARKAIATSKSRLAAAIAAPLGVLSGVTGIERVAAGAKGAGGVRAGLAAGGAELGGEVVEELGTQGTANAVLSTVDPRQSLTEGFGQTAAETIVGSAPTAAAAGVLASQQGREPGTGFGRVFRPAPEAVAPTAARADSIRRFDEAAAAWGLNPKAAQSVREQAGVMPADEVPEYLSRAVQALAKRGLFRKAPDDASAQELDRRLRPAEAEPEQGASTPAATADASTTQQPTSQPAADGAAAPAASKKAAPLPKGVRTPEDAIAAMERQSAEDYAATKGRASDTASELEDRESTDILNPKGAAWASKSSANKRLRDLGDGYRLARVKTGWVIKPTEGAASDNQPDMADAAPKTAGASAGRGADAIGGSLAARPVSVEPDSVVPPAAGAAPSAEPAGAVADAGGPDKALTKQTATTTEAPQIDEAAHQAASSPLNALPEPTDAQKEAGNYKVGRVRLSGMDVSIETPKGAERRSKADDPQPWKVTMPAHYGYIRGTTGADGDHVDLFIGDKGDNGRFWVINQTTPDGKKFDEHKIVTGVESADDAVSLYKASFADGFGDKVFHSVTSEKTADEIKVRLGEFSNAKPLDNLIAELAAKAKAAPAPVQETPISSTDAPAPVQKAAESMQVAPADMQALRKKWPGLKDESDDRIRAAEEWDKAQKRVRAAYGQRGDKAGEIQDQLVSEWGQPRIARDQLAYNLELARRLNAEADRVQALENTPGTLESKRADRKAAKQREESAAAADKALSDDIKFNMARVRELERQGRLPPTEAARLLELARGATDKLDAAMRLEGFVSDKQVAPSGAMPVGRTDSAANGPAKQPAQAPGSGPRVIINRLGADGLTDAERDAGMQSYTDPAPELTSSQQPLSRQEVADLERMLGHASAVSTKDMGGHWMAEATGGNLRTPVRVRGSNEAAARRNLLNSVRKVRAASIAQGADEARAAYFKPGHVVRSYGGFDEVLEYRPADENDRWSVQVHEVREVTPNNWARVGKPQDARVHSTQPDAKELDRGPVARLPALPASAVPYTEKRADGAPFPNAAPRGAQAAPAPALAPEPAPAPKPDKGEIRPFRRADGSIGDEAVPITPPSPEPAAPAAPAPAASANTIFTEDAAAAARARLKAKLGRTQSGIDPETLMDGITLAGFHVERGARKFAAYAKAMVNDLGDGVKPYLQSWYMALRADPRATAFKADMDKASAVEDLTPAEIDAMVAAAPAELGGAAETVQEQNDGQENTNVSTNLPSDGPQALDEMAAEEGGGTEGRGAAGGGAADGREAGPGQGAGADGAAVPATRGGRGGAGGIRAAATRGRRRRGTVGDGGAGEAGAGVPADDAVDLSPEAASPPNIPAQNFRITPELRLGRGGEVEKFNDNMAAVRVLKQVEQERRRATPAEQAILARYVGWGGLANAFPAPLTGEFKLAWKDRGEALRELLTPAEYAAARRSTRNAHYTSEVVVSAMWSAARRLGYRGGLALESSMGPGNFLGMAPEGMPTRFIGIEYDSLTARIATLLYPQAAVLHSGFQKVPLANGAFALNIGNPPFGSESLRFQYKPELTGVSIHNQFFRAGLDAVRPGGLQIMVVSRFLMDAQDKASRLALARKGRLVAAIRLPDTAFKENARTEVVTDIVILQRYTPEEESRANAIVDAYLQPKNKDAGKERERWMLADQIPDWVETSRVPDPLGGEPMVVNRYFANNPRQVLGVLERSGSMQHGADITVRLDDPKALEGMLAAAVERLPEGISNIGDEVIAATEARFKMLGDALRIAVANEEPGYMKFDEDGKLTRVIDREFPEGGDIMARQTITPDSAWSESLSMDTEGRWYKLEVQTGPDGKPLKLMKAGKATKRNVYDRTVYATEADVPAGLRLGQAGYDRLVGIVGLRDLLKRQLVLETEDAPVAMMEANRKSLAAAYQEFVDKHGPLGRKANLALAMTMPDGGLVVALETAYDAERTEEQAKKSGLPAQAERVETAPIMRQRMVFKQEAATTAASAADALVITLAERGRVDMDRIAQLRGISAEAAATELQAGDKPLVFMDPESNDWQTADAYLSGLVRRKLVAAKAAGMELNVKALEAVQPEAWTAENVTAQIGATWVPPDVYAAFAEHLLGGKARASFSPATNSFTLVTSDRNPAKADQWDADGAPATYILTRLLNSQAVVVTYVDQDKVTRVDQEKTSLAILKAKEIVNEFGDWVFKDGERRARLVSIFNEKFNTRVSRQFDGQHLTLPGKVPDSVIAMRRHQKNAIWRGISSQFLLLDHVVGSGKTFTGIARAMERRRMGLARKPAIMVPNHLVEQWAADVYRLYPGAKVLAAGQKDFEPKRRRRLFGKIATGDWDIVIVPHSSFGFIGIAPETEQRFLEQEMRDAEAAIKDAWEQAKEDGQDDGRRKPFGVKEAERLAEKIQQRMDKIAEGTRDRLLTFEQLGIDDLTVDEAHEFKNLYYSSRLTGVRGMGNKTGSRKAADLYNKVRVLRESGGAVTFMTGTPVSNSAVELYTMMRYLAADELADQGLTHFDAWRTQYVEATPAFEPTESGRLKEVTRLGRTWSNMRSLMESYYQFTDAVSNDDIKKWYAEDNDGAKFPVPPVKGGERQLVKMSPTPAQDALLKQTMADFDALPNIQDPYDRNKARLRLMDRARKLSLDIRAVNSLSNSAEKNGKLEVLSRNVKRIYDQWNDDLGTQVIFLDRSVPKAKGDDKIIKEYDELVARRDAAAVAGDDEAFQDANDALEKYDSNEIAELRSAQGGGWNAYQQIKDNLVALGIPANEIRFIQEATNDEQKQAMFDAVNGGKVRVLIGSTPRMGAGTNVQQRLVGLHHADVTWKPSDIEQREGRIIRQGNKLLAKYGDKFEVEILAYATERTVDAKMWDLNATKLRTINGLRNYDGAFTMDIEDEESVSMAEMAALASGNPLLLERVKLESQISTLELQQRAHQRKGWGALDAVERARAIIEDNPAKIEQAKARAARFQELQEAEQARTAGRTVTVEGAEFTSLSEAFAAAKAAVDLQQDGKETARYAINVNGRRVTSKDAISDAITAALGDAQPFQIEFGGTVYTQRTVAGREAAPLINKAMAEVNASKRDVIVDLGTMYGLRVVADLAPSRYRKGFVSLDITLLNGNTTVSTVNSQDLDPGMQVGTPLMRDLLGNLYGTVADGAASISARYMERQLEDAKRDLPELEAKLAAVAVWPKAGELTGKRDRLRQVVEQLAGNAPMPAEEDAGSTNLAQTGSPAANEADVLFNRASLDGSTGRVFGTFAALGDQRGYPQRGLRDAMSRMNLQVNIPLVRDPELGPATVAQFNLGARTISYNPSFQTLTRAEWAQVMAEELMHAVDAVGIDSAISATSKRLAEGGDIGAEVRAMHASGKGLADMLDYPLNPAYGFSPQRIQAELFARLAVLYHGDQHLMQRSLPTAYGAYHALFGTTLLGDGSRLLRDVRADTPGDAGAGGQERPAAGIAGSAGPGGGGQEANQGLDALRRRIARVFDADVAGGSVGPALASRRELQSKVTHKLGAMLSDPGTLSWWDKSFGTPYNLAQRYPAFKRVFDAVQGHMSDISDFANKAADLAPAILPRLESLRDVFKGPLNAQDATAIQRPIFDGTLLWARDTNGKAVTLEDLEASAAEMSADDKARKMMRDRRLHPRVMAMWQGQPQEWFENVVNAKYEREYLRPGIVWTPQELRTMFKLTDRQIGLYQQFRAATDKSLDNLAVTTMVRIAQDPSLRAQVEGMGPDDAAEVVRRAVEFKVERQAIRDGMDPDAATALAEKAGDKITDLADRAAQLKAEGYAPLMRFGNRFADVTVDGERVFFGMYESSMERALDVARLQRTFPGAAIRQGTVSQESYKLFEGVSPETLAMFADIVGLTDEQSKDQLFQEYLRNAVANRSALKRLIHRKGIEGFSEDVARVLAAFVTSNARASANNLNAKGILDAIEAIDPAGERTGAGELKDYATKLREFVQAPSEQLQAIRGMLFHWFLGGNISSAIVNMTQPFQTTIPELSKLVGAAGAAKLVRNAAFTVAAKRTGDLGEALKRAADEGKVSPQEYFHLMALAQGAGHLRTGDGGLDKAMAAAGNGITRLAHIWGRPFAWAEQFNRRVTFIAGYQAATAKGLSDPYRYAVDLIDATQFVYGMGNRPVLMRTGVGAVLLTFKMYTISMLEQMVRNSKTPEGRRALALMLLAMLILGGLEGLPFREDVEDIIDAIMQRMGGRNWQTRAEREKAIKAALANLMSPEAAELTTRFLQKGLSGIPGAPIDVSGRFSMANIVPATSALTVKQDRASDILELLGPVGSLLKQGGQAAGALADGKPAEAVRAALPVAGQNLAKGIEMGATGEFRDNRQNLVVPVSLGDAAAKGAGFQPNSVAQPRSNEWLQRQRVGVARVREAQMVDAMARAVRDKDQAALNEAVARWERWNQDNPDSPIVITADQVRRRVENMQSTSKDRVIRTTPRELRPSVVEALQ